MSAARPSSTGRGRAALAWAACALALAGCAWLWFSVMERSPYALPYTSQLALDNPMLGAGTLLRRHGHAVSVEKRLGGVNLAALPDGTLILADNGGQVNARQAQELLAWVGRGNTLLLQPKWAALRFDERERRQGNARGRNQPLRPLTEPDPLAGRLGVALSYRTKLRAHCDTAEALPPESDDEDSGAGAGNTAKSRANRPRKELRQLTCVTLPGGSHPLALDTGTEVLESIRPGPAPLWSDIDAMSVRVYTEGRGHIALLSDNYFNNQRLPRFDHAELLLGLASLNRQGRHVMLVLHADAVPWYAWLWRAAWMPLTALAVLLALLLWRAARRFGPLLPEPSTERRSLLEHVEASGNWLWRAQGGRATLLAAARRETELLLQRRAPELHMLAGPEKTARLARLCGVPPAAMHGALHGPAASQPAAYTAQIQLLQQVRNLHERQ